MVMGFKRWKPPMRRFSVLPKQSGLLEARGQNTITPLQAKWKLPREPPYSVPLTHSWNFFDLIDGLIICKDTENWANMVSQMIY